MNKQQVMDYLDLTDWDQMLWAMEHYDEFPEPIVGEDGEGHMVVTEIGAWSIISKVFLGEKVRRCFYGYSGYVEETYVNC